MILRAVALKDARTTALTSCGQGTIYDVGAVYSGTKAYAGVHIVSSSTGGLKVRLQNSSSSGGGGMADVFTFTCSAARAAEWLTPLTTATLSSTFRQFWRAIWETSTCGESYKFVPFMGIQ